MTWHSDAHAYLADKTVFWINLQRSTDRHQQWMHEVAPLFGETVRVNAVDWQTVDDGQAFKFVDGWNRMFQAHHGQGVFIHPPQSLVRYQAQTAKASQAILTSHLVALSRGIGDDDDRFFVSEDDIRPRGCLWNEDVAAPPADADVAIWSGGLPMAAVRTDDKHYVSGMPMRWVEVKPSQRFNTLGAGLYEVTKNAAQTIRYAVERNPMGPYDHRWGFAFECLKVYRLKPNAFAQAGPSVRNNADRKPVLERTKVIA